MTVLRPVFHPVVVNVTGLKGAPTLATIETWGAKPFNNSEGHSTSE